MRRGMTRQKSAASELLPEQMTKDELVRENWRLLNELESVYQNMDVILDDSARETEIAYHELEQKYTALENLYEELSKKENLLVHLEKMSSIGQFISEIIHELNNPLTVITMSAEGLLLDGFTPDQKKDFTERIEKNAQHMAKILTRFRDIAYKENSDFRLFNLNENITEWIGTVILISIKKIRIKTEYYHEDLIIEGDPVQICQILLNLSKNAFDSMTDENSFLRISTKLVTSDWIRADDNLGKINCRDSEEWNNLISEKDQFALIEVTDNGIGINKEYLEDIFLPFFTTKAKGLGSGLGLSISKDIVTRHNGNLVYHRASSSTNYYHRVA